MCIGLQERATGARPVGGLTILNAKAVRMQDLPRILILAAGKGSRFNASGGSGNKLDALLEGKTLLEHTLTAVRASGLPWHIETGPHPGMSDSIAAAVGATRDAPGWLILPADLPLIQADTLRQIAFAQPVNSIATPVWQGKRGHPVRFPIEYRDRLVNLSGAQGAASLLTQASVTEVQVEDRGCQLDVDTLEDLQQLLEIRLKQLPPT